MITMQNNIFGFRVSDYKLNKKIKVVVLDENTIDKFAEKISNYDVQAIEYKPFLRFYIANCLNHVTNNTLGSYLSNTIKNRLQGAILLQFKIADDLKSNEANFIDFNIMLATAISHLIGVPNLDSMSGKFYARFSVKDEDNSDSYLRQAYRRMELHNDGTYVKESTDWVIMQKIIEINAVGGESLLLHIDDWQDLAKFYNHPLAKKPVKWSSPTSKNISYETYHPVFVDNKTKDKAQMSFIDQFAEPADIKQGMYLYAISKSLESEANTTSVKLAEGSMLIINNYVWLHGRNKFIANKNLHRELLRQRGVFAKVID